MAYTVQPVPAEAVAEQQASYTALLQSLGHASFDEIEVVLDEREEVELEEGLSPKVVKRLQERMTGARTSE